MLHYLSFVDIFGGGGGGGAEIKKKSPTLTLNIVYYACSKQGVKVSY